MFRMAGQYDAYSNSGGSSWGLNKRIGLLGV
jgi:hypothetical protein